MKTSTILSVAVAASLGLAAARGAEIEKYYHVEDIATPPGVVPECQGLSFLPDGRMVAVFDHGEVYFYTPATKEWKRFAEGLHTPMGVLAISEREVLVTQRAELTRLVDTDGDGVADDYECVCDAWGISGNYHEFAFGLVRDREGNFYVPLGSGSGGGVSRYETRGEFRPEGYPPAGHFSSVPYRGWVVKISPDGKLTPIASGLREANGIGIDPQGRVFVTDNQGEWTATSKLHYVQPGRFYGLAPSLVWRDDYKKGRSVLELDRLRTEGTILFPHAILASSPGQPAFDLSGGKFGPFAGQMFLTEYDTPRLLRVMLEEVHGELQGAATTFYTGSTLLRPANIRMAFSPDGSLWCSQSERKNGWPGAEGIHRLVWNGRTPLDVHDLHLSNTGFDFTFTLPVDRASALDPAAYQATRYYYKYQPDYGSPRIDIHPVRITAVRVSEDRLTASLDVDSLQPGYIYEFNLKGIKSAEGSPLVNTLVCYTANRLQDGSTVTLPRPPPTGEIRGSGKDRPAGYNLQKGGRPD